MGNDVFWLRIALDAPEMEIRVTDNENKILRNNEEPMSRKRDIIANAIQNRFINLGNNSRVEIFYDDIEVTVPMDKKEEEKNKMENQNQINIIGKHIVKLANEFNHTLVSDNYGTDYERNEDTQYFDDVLMECIRLINELGYSIKFEERKCENPYEWNEYVKFDITNTVTGETTTFYCDCSTRKYKVSFAFDVECEAENENAAERIAREKMNIGWCPDYETECYVKDCWVSE